MQFLEKIFLPLNIKRDKQNNNLLTEIKNRSIDLLEWLKKAFPSFVNVNNGLTNTAYLGDSTSVQLGGDIIQDTYIEVSNYDLQFKNAATTDTTKFGIFTSSGPLGTYGYNVESSDGNIIWGYYNRENIGADKEQNNMGVRDVNTQERAVSGVFHTISGDFAVTSHYDAPYNAFTNNHLINSTGFSFDFSNNALARSFVISKDEVPLFSISEDGVISMLNISSYADDTAAITAGLTTGNLYKTTTGGITSLNIVP